MGGGVIIATLAANNYGEIISHFIGGCVAQIAEMLKQMDDTVRAAVTCRMCGSKC